jgi:chemotaxis family two-component system response regulator Rcp1
MMRPIEILIVEDNPVDVLMTREALKSGRIMNQLSVVEDGEQAIAFLFRRGEYSEAPRPDLVLLDLNLPKKDGREILAEIKNDADLRSIPVVVLTTSQAEEDVLRSYDCGANCFIVKPVDLEQFTSTILSLEDFWFSIVRLPVK